ncbi:MAG TPA: nodulation protein NfeD [Anaerolineae bacterium]
MRAIRTAVFLFTWLCGMLAALVGPVYAQPERGAVYVVEIEGVINPPVANYLVRVLDEAAGQEAGLVVIQIDTPGGLDSSMREMTRAILASPVPVAVYVAPSGARAASAGLFVLASAHVAAMAPGTNTGAAHPVGLGGETDEVMTSKAVNDAAATIRSLAEQRGRNAQWAEQAVRESVSVTESEALELNVIEVVARDLDDLLRQIDGWTVETASGEVTLDVIEASRHQAPMHFAERFLHVLTDPNIAFILLSVGSIGIVAELYNPGTFFPGIFGAISLILAFYALGNLPTNWAGVALIVLALVLFIAELSAEGTGVLGAGAVIAFFLGGLFLFRPLQPASPALPDLSVSPWLVVLATAMMAGFIFLVVGQIIQARRAPLMTGYEHFAGQVGIVHEKLKPRGRVRFQSQIWFAESRSGAEIAAGQHVRIVGVEGLTLIVEPEGE